MKRRIAEIITKFSSEGLAELRRAIRGVSDDARRQHINSDRAVGAGFRTITKEARAAGLAARGLNDALDLRVAGRGISQIGRNLAQISVGSLSLSKTGIVATTESIAVSAKTIQKSFALIGTVAKRQFATVEVAGKKSFRRLAVESRLASRVIESDGTVTFEFSDGSTQGPITLPRQPVRFRGAYTAGQIYEVGDIVHSPETVFVVTVDHVGVQFDPAIALGRIRSLSGIPDTPADGKRYVRKTGQWVELSEPAPVWGLPTDHDATQAYPRFSVVAAEVEGVEHLFVAMAAIEANGAVPGTEGSGWRRMTN